MTDQHPITPPPELFAKWLAEAKRLHPGESTGFIAGEVARLAYRAGADRELEACCDWLIDQNTQSKKWFDPRHEACALVGDLRTARRPKPPSLKELALEELEQLRRDANSMGMGFDAPTIHRALEHLPDD